MRKHVVSTGHTSWTDPSIKIRRARRENFWSSPATIDKIPLALRVRRTRKCAYDRAPARTVDAKIPSSTTDDSTGDSVEDSLVDETDSTGNDDLVDNSVDDSTGSDRLALTADNLLSLDKEDLEPPEPPEWETPDVEDQLQLGEFEDIDVDDGVDETGVWEDRLDDLPVFLDDDEIPSVTVDNPSRIGPEYCDQCGARHSLDSPAESGVGALRAGDKDDGPSAYVPCDYDEIRSCSCCGCPSCGAQSVRHRKTKDPTYACNNPACGVEFENPIARPESDDVERERLYWTCESCGGLTQADFAGIPVSMLD